VEKAGRVKSASTLSFQNSSNYYFFIKQGQNDFNGQLSLSRRAFLDLYLLGSFLG
jgi:hypothetical protein